MPNRRPSTASDGSDDEAEAVDGRLFGMQPDDPEVGEVDVEGGERTAAAGRADEDWDGAGLCDCSVADVAVDYNLPIEFVIDVMSVYGVRLPIHPGDSIRERLTTEEIERMLELITSFDSMDLSDRYSDQTIAELAEDYDVDVDRIVSACEAEGIHLPVGRDTRLQLSREDRVLDIARGRASVGGHEYPPLLQGLIVGETFRAPLT
jgi:hypothetical protein